MSNPADRLPQRFLKPATANAATMNRPRPPSRIAALPAPVALVIATFALLTLLVALLVPFPSSYDELQHLSVVRAQFEHPALFADPRRYLVLRQDDLARWSSTKNYINHPAFYYLAMSVVPYVAHSILVARLVNVVLAVATLVLVVRAGLSRFASRFGQAAFAIVAASFPKAALIGGMVNNDNLAGLAGAIVFAGLMGVGQAGWMLGIGLALAGWTKLTALIALSIVVAADRGWQVLKGRDRRKLGLARIAVGAGVGMLPYLVNVVETGHVLYVNEAVFRAPAADRPAVDLAGFAAFFFRSLAMKWPAAEFGLPLWAAAALLAMCLGLAGIGIASDRASARIGLAFAVALAATLAIHCWFGWSAYQRIGDQTIAQTRYYNVLWPGIALAAAGGIVRLHRRSSALGIAALLPVIMPTIVGGALVALVAG